MLRCMGALWYAALHVPGAGAVGGGGAMGVRSASLGLGGRRGGAACGEAHAPVRIAERRLRGGLRRASCASHPS